MKRGVMVVAIVLGMLLILWLSFYYTGGSGLVRVSRHYLLRTLPDKKYVWSDFIPNKDSKQVTGFYSTTFSNEEVIAIWTLAGLQRFYPWHDRSVYYYRDACAVVKEVIEKKSPTEPLTNPYVTYLDMGKWREQMRQEYMVTVKWEENGGKRVVDKLWAISGRYKMLGRIGKGVCD